MNSKQQDTDRHCNDLTQLSSREQLSALMDGALPADQTRFLLRRLQHDDSLAASWERWRIAGETMRGLAPTQRLPVDFAERVAAALRGERDDASAPVPPRTPVWLHWSGGAAIAASLALALVAVLIVRPVNAPADAGLAPMVATAAVAVPEQETRAPQDAPRSQTPAPADQSKTLVRATRVAAAPRAAGERSPAQPSMRPAPPAQLLLADAQSIPEAAVQSPIVTRPWPRAVLPQYASGGLTVDFGGGAGELPAPNPFQQPRLAMPPASESSETGADATAGESETDASVEPAAAADPR